MLYLLLLSIPAPAETVRYTIDLHDRTAAIRARFPAVVEDAVKFTIHSWAGYDFDSDIEQVAASDLNGEPLPVESNAKGLWIVHNRRRPFELAWRVKAAKDSMVGSDSGSQFHATLLPEWALLWGHAFVLQPAGSPLSAAPVEVRVNPNEYKSWDSTLPPNGRLLHLADLTDQLFIAGSWRRYQRPAGRYYFATSQQAVSDLDLMAAVDRIFTAQTRYMGTRALDSPMFVFADGRTGFGGGTVVRNSAVFYPDLSRDLQSNNSAALRIIAHELFHLWNGSRLAHAHDAAWSDGRYGWFMEGFTEYYSGATLYREGIMDGPGFAAFLNRLLLDYAANPQSLRATIDDLGSRHWRDRDHQNLPYIKGALIALLLDLRLHAKDKRLDDFMRLMLSRPAYDLADLRSAWLRLAGPSGMNFWNRFVVAAEPLPFSDVFQSAGIGFDEPEMPVFDLGFTFDTPTLVKGNNHSRGR
jgi:predicted metalloprotease with PDZ domain